ncbi:hypothetical protein CEXT_42631 [Caerostris extrusa]|uniref:Uncharacterized protein n=1 Tax=Caerostris extrusa TaxID=172846 RepID=A0AAV4MVN9_CAEEX|nr:hypothetical protein CEXT_42631 [Caerostris extrusa]
MHSGGTDSININQFTSERKRRVCARVGKRKNEIHEKQNNARTFSGGGDFVFIQEVLIFFPLPGVLRFRPFGISHVIIPTIRKRKMTFCIRENEDDKKKVDEVSPFLEI